MRISAREIAKCRRDHRSVENRLHHILDDPFWGGSVTSHIIKKLALIRKFAYNLIRIIILRESLTCPLVEALDIFADSPDLLSIYFQ